MPGGKEVSEIVQKYVKFRTYPVGIKLLEDEHCLPQSQGIKRPNWRGTMCQFITVSRTYGWPLLFARENLGMPNCAAVIGLGPMPDEFLKGTMMHGIWFQNEEDAKLHMEQMPRIISGRFRYAMVSPLFKELIEPDIVLFYGTPAQMMRILTGLQWSNYERLNFYYVGETACADSIAQCYLSQKPSLALPCFGERRFGGVMEDEMVLAVPWNNMLRLMEGLVSTEKTGIRYPIPNYGLVFDPADGMPQKYQDVIKRFREEADNDCGCPATST